MRRNILFAIDLFAAAISPFLALVIRDGEFLSSAKLASVIQFSGVTFFVAVAVFMVADVHRGVGRYMSLPDLGRVAAAASVVVLLSLVILFAFNRLEGIPRSLPLIEWLCLIMLVCGARVAARLWREWRPRGNARQGGDANEFAESVMVIGLNDLTELYLQAVKNLAPGRLQAVGILAKGEGLKGRLVQRCEILGRPEELSRKLAELEVHGIDVGRIVVTEKMNALSEEARSQLLEAERARGIILDLFTERLGLEDPPSPALESKQDDKQSPPGDSDPPRAVSTYRRQKRIIDVIGAVVLIVALAPLFAFIALIVAFDVGLPLIFWQRRAGLDGRPFNLYKFRTMKGAHDANGGRVADTERVSRVGDFLRRTRLDELPQLYNVLVGEMSLVGPRPLLPQDLPSDPSLRFQVRPGLSGWAQVSGGRDVSVQDKAALDAWYVAHLSPSVDLKVLRRTLRMVIWGEKMNWKAIRRALQHVKDVGAFGRTQPPRTLEAVAEKSEGAVGFEDASESSHAAPAPSHLVSSGMRQRRRQIATMSDEAVNG